MNHCIAVILGGGAGTRLFPLTLRRSKPAVPLAGKYRLIDIPVSNCINSNISRIFVLTQFNSASLNRHLARTYRFDYFRRGFVTILAAEQTRASADWFQGTADAVRQSMPHLEVYRHSHVLILSGDQLYSMDYSTMMDEHRARGADITIATIPVTAREAPEFGILKTDADGVITEFYEKPAPDELAGKASPVSDEMQAAGRTYLASMGIYVFNSDVLRESLDVRDHHDFGKEIIPAAIENRRVVSYPFTGYWSDIGTIRSFFEANLMLAEQEPPFSIYNPLMPLYTNVRLLPPAKIQRSHIRDSLVSEGSVIVDSRISNSVIGIRSFVGKDTTINNAIIMGADYYPWHDFDLRERVEGPSQPGIGAGSTIEGAIIDKNVSIGERCVISNRNRVQEADGENYYIRDGIVVIPKNARIEEGTII
ncbi:MAG: glucose-1-phosphate adenylyltransferase [Rhodothermales bacterium]